MNHRTNYNVLDYIIQNQLSDLNDVGVVTFTVAFAEELEDALAV